MKNPDAITVEISEITYMTHQKPITDNLVHYRNIFASPENFIKRKVDYSKMKVFDEKFRKESERLETFKSSTFSDKNLVKLIAKSGFYFKENSNNPFQVRCIFCQGNISDWKKNDIPLKRHKYSYPTCPYIIYLNVGNEPLKYKLKKQPCEDPDVTRPNMKIEIIYTKYKLKGAIEIFEKVDNLDVDIREKSFDMYPNLKYLALKGFLIENKNLGQSLNCTSCLNEIPILKGVEKLSEHILHKFDCKYKNIDEILSKEIHFSKNSNEDFCDVEFSLIDEEIDARLEMRSISQLPDLGIDRDKLKSVLEHRLRTTGKDFDSLFELIHEIKKNLNYSKQCNLKDQEFALIDYQCVVCLDKSVEVVFLPCGHLKTCTSCSEKMTTCPVCRLQIIKRVKRFKLYSDNESL